MSRNLCLALLAASALAAGRPDEWVVRRAREVRDGDVEAWRRIPWADGLPSAAGLARRDGRLLFVFSHEGNIDTGRC